MIDLTTYYPATKDVVLFLLAIYAAILSTVNFRQAARKERRSIRVVASTATPSYGPELGPPFIKVEAANDGHRPVAVSLLALELPDRKRLKPFGRNNFPWISDTELPARLGEGETAYMFVSYADVGGALLARGVTAKTTLTPICEDTVGGRHVGEPWEVDPREFLRMAVHGDEQYLRGF